MGGRSNLLIALLKVKHMISYKKRLSAVILALCLLSGGCKAASPGAPAGERTAEAAARPETDSFNQEAGNENDVAEEGMVPVQAAELKDGVYPVKVDSSSNMFQITSCELTVKEGTMRAVMTMGGKGYLKLFMGTGKEALEASDRDFIPYVQTESGTHTFTVPVKALDMGIDCSAFSKKKEKWYDRVLVFRSGSLPPEAFAEGKIVTAESLKLEDGMYTAEVRLEGGSGRAQVESPAPLRVEGGKVIATIIWGSSNYDYMKVNGETFNAVSTEGKSTFEIPVMGFDRKIPVIADTLAMSEPHEISYTLIFDSATLKKAE